MKTYGDVPKYLVKPIRDLITLERWFHDNSDAVPSLAKAKGLTCIAHDYYAMHMEEEGYRFLYMVELHCPGYFKGPIYSHINKDSEFRVLINNLNKNPFSIDDLAVFGFEYEQI